MTEVIYDFFYAVGLSQTPPQTMAELIPYLLEVFVGLVLVLSVFRVIGGIVQALLTAFRRL